MTAEGAFLITLFTRECRAGVALQVLNRHLVAELQFADSSSGAGKETAEKRNRKQSVFYLRATKSKLLVKMPDLEITNRGLSVRRTHRGPGRWQRRTRILIPSLSPKTPYLFLRR